MYCTGRNRNIKYIDMKRVHVLILFVIFCLTACRQAKESGFPVLKGPYLGQNPPGTTPGDNANSAFVSPDGKYLFFSSSRKDTAMLQVTSGTPLSTIIRTKSMPGNGASAIYWVDAKIIEELRLKENILK
jgi:hypothetical protein